MTIDYREGITI
ncbi:uncharacterized protein FTOL_13733 [Fusarium torulosum]|uniref:Uncharacterized protein n=1 Tax=Fusarium torulosum TaxID=33205 RepID=A0AAE8MMC0_9HYPO|nr:uncharacterized protein FTOL_13733 [Fusarium torulosum]